MELQYPKTIRNVRRRAGQTRHLIYDYILTFSEAYGFPPTIREIAAAVGVSSPGTVSAHLKQLEKEHLIRRYDYRARAIQPCGASELYPLPGKADMAGQGGEA